MNPMNPCFIDHLLFSNQCCGSSVVRVYRRVATCSRCSSSLPMMRLMIVSLAPRIARWEGGALHPWKEVDLLFLWCKNQTEKLEALHIYPHVST